MWSSRIFWKLYLASAGLMVLMAAGYAVLASSWQSSQLSHQIEDRLHDTAIVLRSHMLEYILSDRPDQLQPVTDQLSRETGLRMTWIAADGRVLADSDEDPDRMDNHSMRPEVVEARHQGTGTAKRFSNTVEANLMYVSLRAGPPDAPVGYARVAMPMSEIEQQQSAAQRLIWIVALGLCGTSLLLTYLVVARIVRPLVQLTHAAQAIGQGERFEVEIPNRDEIGALATSLRRMSRQLNRHIQELQENGDRLATVMGSMIEGVIAVDREERILIANAAAGSLLDFPHHNVVGRRLWEAVRNAAVQQLVSDALSGGSPPRLEFEIVRTQRVVAMNATRLPGQPTAGVVLVLHDVTELRRLESMRQEFVANVSHELKTPLTSIKAYAETLLDGALEDPDYNRDFVVRIEEQAERLHELIVDVLSLAKIESGREKFEIGTVALREIVERSVEEHRAAAATKRIEIEVEPWIGPHEACAQADGMRTVIDNLLDNAIKYTPAGGRIAIRCRQAQSAAVLEVEDNGIGIAPEQQARIFERFYRVDQARTRTQGGTGLGLSIIKHLVQAFGGAVEVRSQLGVGSTFVVRLPIEETTAREPDGAMLATPVSRQQS